MHKKNKILISFTLLFIFSLFHQTSSAKYVIENVFTVAKIDIDRCQPDLALIDIISSNANHPTYANKTHLITGHIKITEKNIVKNDLSPDTIKISVANHLITPEFKSFSLISENATEKIYEFSFTNTICDGTLMITIPEGIILDKSGLVNEQKNFSTGICIDNTPPSATFKESANPNGKSKAEIISNEKIVPINGWNISEENTILSKEFMNPISYVLPVTDFAQNTSEILIPIEKASNILFQYGFYAPNKQFLVSSGKTAFFKTSSSQSIYAKLSGSSVSFLQGKTYIYHNTKTDYNPIAISKWITSKFKNVPDFSIVYQTCIKDIGWLKASSYKQENMCPQSKSISAFRIGLIPTTEKQYLIDYWNRDTNTTN